MLAPMGLRLCFYGKVALPLPPSRDDADGKVNGRNAGLARSSEELILGQWSLVLGH
jgi:hypothetical protein